MTNLLLTIVAITALPFYIIGTTLLNFFALLFVMILLVYLTQRWIISKYKLTIVAKVLIISTIFILINLIPLPLPASVSIEGDNSEARSVAIGWPAVFDKFYLEGPTKAVGFEGRLFGDLLFLAVVVLPLSLAYFAGEDGNKKKEAAGRSVSRARRR